MPSKLSLSTSASVLFSLESVRLVLECQAGLYQCFPRPLQVAPQRRHLTWHSRISLVRGRRGRRDEWPLLSSTSKEPMKPDTKPEACLHRLQCGTLRHGIIASGEVVMHGAVADAAYVVESVADIAVQEALAVQGP